MSKKQKGGAAKDHHKKIKLQIAAQSCHSMLQLFKKSADKKSNTNTKYSVSVFILLIIYNY